MSIRVDISNHMLNWAMDRAGVTIEDFPRSFPPVQKWLDGECKPTVKQLEAFSRKVFLPYGFLLLPDPPDEKLPIPYFRGDSRLTENVSVNVYDTILTIQNRQDWLRSYLIDNGHEELPFVGKFDESSGVSEIVDDIRNELGLNPNWAEEFPSWEKALSHLVELIEDIGIITSFNGVVGNNTYRKIALEECRGFVIVDKYAPFLFVNNSDYKSAQMFTIVHELAHIWTGKSAGFDFRKMQPADDPIEQLCDKVAAEFLVPEAEFIAEWRKNKNIKSVARKFKVSQIVIARRALDTGQWSKRDFFAFYDDYQQTEVIKKNRTSAGGDFYATARKKVSITFASHIHNAVKSGKLMYRDAYRLTSLKGDTFEKFFAKSL